MGHFVVAILPRAPPPRGKVLSPGGVHRLRLVEELRLGVVANVAVNRDREHLFVILIRVARVLEPGERVFRKEDIVFNEDAKVRLGEPDLEGLAQIVREAHCHRVDVHHRPLRRVERPRHRGALFIDWLDKHEHRVLFDAVTRRQVVQHLLEVLRPVVCHHRQHVLLGRMWRWLLVVRGPAPNVKVHLAPILLRLDLLANVLKRLALDAATVDREDHVSYLQPCDRGGAPLFHHRY
mmetsp:Transcript_25046/g.67589  ORF Transcript_25046/g.67589 Transcript_25046/m.67589 type:complete len:236 (+) Transcript_25046:541-1248(+)